MANARILVVEDENIIALDLKDRLTRLGYQVPKMVAYGEQAVQQAEALAPDLVLMDIMLKGAMDGVEAAEQIRQRCNLPVIYLTAHSDERTLERARLTEPYGYILKPFEDRELQLAIEIALYKHRMEAQLKENERWLVATLKSIRDAVIATDAAGRIKFINPAAEAATGWDQAEAVGQELALIFNVVDEETHTGVGHSLAPVLQGGAPVGLVPRALLITRDQKRLPIEGGAAPIWTEHGELTGAVLVFRDVTGQRQTEAALRASEMRLRRIADNMLDMIAQTDGQGRYEYVSPSHRTILGYDEARLVGQSVFDYLHPDDLEAVRAAVATAISTAAPIRIEARVRHADGHYVWIESVANLLADDGGQAIGSIIGSRDITERRRAEEQLRDAEARYRALVENIPAIVYLDQLDPTVPAGHIPVYISPQITPTLGYRPEEILADPGLWPSLLMPEDQQLAMAADAQHYHAGSPLAGEYRMRARDGHVVWLRDQAVILRSVQGQSVYSQGVLLDITGRKQAETDLAAANAGLERAVARARQLAVAAEEANRLKNEFLANTSHELRTPLTGILGSLSVVLDGLCDTPQEEREFLQSAYGASRNLLSIVNDILDIAKIEAGRLDMNLQVMEVGGSLVETAAQMRAPVEAKGLQLVLELPPEPGPKVRADPDKVRQILLNLVGNAVKFTERGQIVLGVQLDSEERVAVYVRDTGIGITPEQQAWLFQPFVQADGSTTRKYGGTGLGLTISRRLAEMMGGTLMLYSAGAGQGCTLTLTLPRQVLSGA